jgi:hypothetical protein
VYSGSCRLSKQVKQARVLQSRGIVRKIREGKNGFLVSLRNHDGYFHVEDQTLRDRVRNAEREQKEIAFIYDRTLQILSISGAD